ncbi:MAG: YigZ family protein [Clostridium sp.]|nr:YigZ family protein [Clostridium sp.]MCM1444324.1 YigZ family protein [Candidatus Amulumruptor caecigallinarius]
MHSIKSNVENEYTIKKSKFICKLYRINNLNNIDIILKSIKMEYKDSTHICYAYILDNIKRFNDDNEPSGTAGIPILNVLEKNELNYILCIVIRYFGGIKLGSGGLIRAYSTSVSNTLKLANVIELVNGKVIEITFSYENIKKIDKILSNFNILNKEFNDDIKYVFEISNKDFTELNLDNLCINIKIIKTDLIVKN